MARWLRCGDEHTIDAEARREAGACCLEVDVAGRGVVSVANEQVHVANDRRLIGEVANIGGEIVGVGVDARELYAALGSRRQSLDESLELSAFDSLVRYGQSIRVGHVVRPTAQRVVCGGDDQDPVVVDRLRAKAVMEQVLSRESGRQWQAARSTVD